MSFDSIAPHYRWLETIAFGNALQDARVFWINKVPRPRRALILGEGNGRFLCELLRVYPKINIDCMDASERMLQLARQRVQRTHPDSLAHIRFLHQDILNWSPSSSYDLLVTHFFLDCFRREEVKAIIQKVAGAAQPEAVWLLADFAIPRETFARMEACLSLHAMYLFFRFMAHIQATEVIDPTPYLDANGFIRSSRKLSRRGMLKSELYVASNQPG